jgi:hypothetical protein
MTGMPAAGLPCNWCGYVNLPSTEPKPQPSAVPPKPEPTAPRSAGPPSELAQWSDDESNSLPYRVPQEEVKTRRCGECGKLIDIQALVCVHCGYDAEKKQKSERTFQPIDRRWDAGWPFERRLAVFIVFQVLNVASLVAYLIGGGKLPASVFGVVFGVFLQAFILGTYDAVRIRRNRKGQTEVFVNWRFCFVPLAPKRLNWKEFEGVAWGHYDGSSVIDWLIVIFLLPACIVPAIIFWWYVLRPDRYYAAFARDRGYPDTYLYRGMSEQQAKEIAQTATDATGLPLVTPI